MKIILKKISLILTALLITVLITSCQTKEPIVKNGLALNTIISITTYDSKYNFAVEKAFELIENYENMFSKSIESSDIYKINHRTSETVEVSAETAGLVRKALYYSELSNGNFDITIDAISKIWDFSGTPKVPLQSQIDNAIQNVDYRTISVDGNRITISDPDVTLDLGAIAKGYIADKVKEHLLSCGVENAIINLGGNILCVGNLPTGKPMKIGIQKPFRNDVSAKLSITDKSVVSSGVYERYFEENGKIYHHILNTKTGYPISNGLYSVSIISDNSIDGDALSTALFTLGLEDGMKLVNSYDNIYAIFITDDYELHFSDGAEKFVTE